MNAKRRTEKKQAEITFKEVDFYRERFAEWLTTLAGKEARARRTLQKFLHQAYKLD